MPFRQRIANRVFDMMRKAALKVGVTESAADRFILRSLLFSSGKIAAARHKSKTRERGKLIHTIGPRRDARLRQKASRREQRRRGIYGRAQA
jgi:hypothetical protein